MMKKSKTREAFTMTYQAKFGSYLIIPLKFEGDWQSIGRGLTPQPMETMDLTENVKAMLSGTGRAAVGRCCRVEVGDLYRHLTAAAPQPLQICCDSGCRNLELTTSYLYVFTTQVAFFCLGVTYDHMDALNTLTATGHADKMARVLLSDGTPLPLDGKLQALFGSWNLRKFFDGPSALLLDAFTHTVALLPEYFPTLESLRRITFRLHQMIPLESDMDDESEEDTGYVYAVKSEEQAAYRWGCCAASQKLSYAVADPQMDLAAEMHNQAIDGLPITLLMLYQKFTCLRFTELIAQREKTRDLEKLQQMMLEFRAFGTVTPANLSRWHNIKQIYAHLLAANDIATAVEDVSTKLSILSAEADAREARRSERVSSIITVFGLVSILDSVLSIADALRSGEPIFWHCSTLTAAVLMVLLLLAAKRRK